MKTNRNMADLLAVKATPGEISTDFRMLVFGGFKEVEGHVFFRRLFPHDHAEGLPLHHDSTGYECAVNSIRLEDYLERDTSREPAILAATALKYAQFLAERLREVSSDTFRIIASVSGKRAKMRFHKMRNGESWLTDDLEAYRDEAILVLDSRE